MEFLLHNLQEQSHLIKPTKPSTSSTITAPIPITITIPITIPTTITTPIPLTIPIRISNSITTHPNPNNNIPSPLPSPTPNLPPPNPLINIHPLQNPHYIPPRNKPFHPSLNLQPAQPAFLLRETSTGHDIHFYFRGIDPAPRMPNRNLMMLHCKFPQRS
ncbi:hypothetical protein TgHK011_009050 [Trichoderma gracile]|nr:hypothetical protein TgHK011_009050 [Trichoderma gracile]